MKEFWASRSTELPSLEKKVTSKKLELRVVFDSSAVYSKAEVYLLSGAATNVITQNSSYTDLVIQWYLPEVVRHERQHQMQESVKELLPRIRRLIPILGEGFNIDKDVVMQAIGKEIEKQMSHFDLHTVNPDYTEIDFQSLMLNACYRNPPFSDGEYEKGFRDFLILESFLNVVRISPREPTICQIVFVAKDSLLCEETRRLTANASNVRIVRSIEELQEFINMLVVEVTDAFLAQYLDKCKDYFFIEEQKDTIYYRQNIQRRIETQYKEELSSIPEGAGERSNLKWVISAPRFTSRSENRLFWTTRIAVLAQTYKYVGASLIMTEPPWAPSSSGFNTAQPWRYSPDVNSPIVYTWPSGVGWTGQLLYSHENAYSIEQLPSVSGTILESGPTETRKVVWISGQSVFDVVWSVSFDTGGELSDPEIDKITYIETIWT